MLNLCISISVAENASVKPGLLPSSVGHEGPTSVLPGTAIEVDFVNELLSNIIWFSTNGTNLFCLADSGYFLSVPLDSATTPTSTLSIPALMPLLDSDGVALTTETFTYSGSTVSGDLSLSKGFLAAFSSGFIREFAEPSVASSSIIAKPTNLFELCDTWLPEEVSSGCPDSAPASIISSLLPEDDSESAGSILVSCRTPRDDLTIPGWACNPSTGDSARFSISTNDSFTNLVAMTPCNDCDPHQTFLLLSHGDSNGDQKSISIESIRSQSLTDADDQSGRVQLFSLNVTDVVFLSLSVIGGTDGKDLKIFLFGYNISSSTTSYVIMTYTVNIGVSSAISDRSIHRDFTLSIVILFLLISIGIAIPLMIRFNPQVRARIENIRWLKNAEEIGIVGDSGDENDTDYQQSIVPKKFGHLSPNVSPYTPRELKPINE